MPKGKKECKKCGTFCGPRKIQCDCGYNFFTIKEKIKVKAEVKSASPIIGKGRKKCPQCNAICKLRSSKCDQCDYVFYLLKEKTKSAKIGKGYKKCPKCYTICKSRHSKCVKCNHIFYLLKVKIKPEPIGEDCKKCPQCNKICRARSSKCEACEYVFYFSKKKIKPTPVIKFLPQITDWKTLQNGDKIKVKMGSGPYHLNKETQEKIYLGYYGKFIVLSLDKDGIHCKDPKSHFRHVYIYMGQKCFSKNGIHREPHEVKKIVPRLKKRRKMKK